MRLSLTLVSQRTEVSWAWGHDGADCLLIGHGRSRAALQRRAVEAFLTHQRAPAPVVLHVQSFGANRPIEWGSLPILGLDDALCSASDGSHLFLASTEGWVLHGGDTPPLPTGFEPLPGLRPSGLWSEPDGFRVGMLGGSQVLVGRSRPVVLARAAGVAILERDDECLLVQLSAQTTVTSLGELEPEAEIEGLHPATGVLLSIDDRLVLRSFEGATLDEAPDVRAAPAFVGRGAFGWPAEDRLVLRVAGETVDLPIAGPGGPRRCWTSGERLFVEGGLENAGWVREYWLGS